MKVSIAALVLVFINNINSQVTAFPTPIDVHQHLGSRSPYRFKSNTNDTQITYPDCKDLKIWMIIRHGTRFPCNKDIKKIQNLTRLRDKILSNNQEKKGQLTEKQIKELKDWELQLDGDESSLLTMEGQEEMVLLAKRMHKRFPNAIQKKYNNETFLFRHTATQRTFKSARSFTNGLFEYQDAKGVVYAPVNKVDNLLRFYKHCDRWQQQVKKNPETYEERNLYSVSQEMNKTLESVSYRLGFDTVLTLDEVISMYKFCGYETAWQKNFTSPWCNAFDENTIQTMEYFYDLKSYWVDGYGFELTYRLPCIAFKDMFDIFRGNTSPNATFLFTHSGTILKFLSYLGLYKPESPLRGANLVEDRSWRISNIDCFASNIAFVLFKCENGYHVLTLHQEKIVRLPMCSEDLCPLETLEQYFGDSMRNCDLYKMCKLDENEKNVERPLRNKRQRLDL